MEAIIFFGPESCLSGPKLFGPVNVGPRFHAFTNESVTLRLRFHFQKRGRIQE